MDANIFNATFWLSFCGVVAGILGLVFTAINKSKCRNVECCCGIFKCVRDTDAEVELEEHRIDHGLPPETPTIIGSNLNVNTK
jgi:hypothetical protein